MRNARIAPEYSIGHEEARALMRKERWTRAKAQLYLRDLIEIYDANPQLAAKETLAQRWHGSGFAAAIREFAQDGPDASETFGAWCDRVARAPRRNPDDSPLEREVDRFLDQGAPQSTRRVARAQLRPEAPPRAQAPSTRAGALKEIEELDTIEEAQRGPRVAPRLPKAPKHADEPELADIHKAAAGDGDAVYRLAKKYKRFVRRMAFAFLRAWSPSVASKTLALQADDIAAEVEQRVFVGTERAPPAISRLIAGGKRKGPGRFGFSAGAPPTEAGKDKAARFTTWLGAVVRNIARKHARAGARAARPVPVDMTVAQADALDDVVEQEKRDALAARGREQSSRIVEGIRALQDAGKHDELEVLRRRQKGDSYKQIASDLGVSAQTVADRLYRARRAIEEVSGEPLRGLVGELREGLGAAVPSRRGRPRKNPELEVGGVLVYFEDICDVFDLWDAGVFDDDSALEAIEALADYIPNAV